MSSFFSCPGCGQLVPFAALDPSRSQNGLIACERCQRQFELGIMPPQVISHSMPVELVSPSVTHAASTGAVIPMTDEFDMPEEEVVALELELDDTFEEEPAVEEAPAVKLEESIEPDVHDGLKDHIDAPDTTDEPQTPTDLSSKAAYLSAKPFEDGGVRVDADEEYVTGTSESQMESDAGFDWGVLGSSNPRPRREEASFLRKAIPPVLGGLAAIPIATAILWYGFGRDIGNAAPFVARYVPWIVPRHLAGGSQETSYSSGRSYPSKNTKGTRNTDNKALPRLSDTPSEPLVTPPLVAPESDTEEPTAAPERSLASQNAVPADSKLTESSTKATVPTLAIPEPKVPEPLSVETQRPQSQRPTLPPKNEDLQKLLKTTSEFESLRKRLYETPKDEKLPLIVDYYQAVIRFAEQLAKVPKDLEPEAQQAVIGAGRDLLGDKSTRTMLQWGANGQIGGVAAWQSGDFGALIVDVDPNAFAQQMDTNGLTIPWNLGQRSIRIRVDSDAWIGTNPIQFDSKTSCLFLGKLMENRSADGSLSELTLQVHGALSAE
jgi:hypothetical protein